MRQPLVAPALSLAAGIAAGRFAAFGNRELMVDIAVFAALAAVARWTGSRRLSLAALLLAVFFAGALAELRHRPGPPPEIDFAPREVMILAGCVVEPPALSPDRARFVLELAPGARVRVSLYAPPGRQPPSLRYGQRVELEARLRHPRNYGNPGAFDYQGYLARRQIYWTASAGANAHLKILPGTCGNRAARFAFGLRSTALDRLERLYAGRPYQTGMMQALLVGEKSKVEESWTDQYRITGTYHALVISGMHLAALAGGLFFILRLLPLGQWLPPLAALLIAWAYTAVTGFQTPVLRAASGMTLALVARYLFRRTRLLNLLAALAIGFLAVDPHQLFEASFQLSFLCVAAIAALATPAAERLSTPYRRGLAALGDRDRDLHLPPATAAFRVELRLVAETVALWTRVPQRWVQRAVAAVLSVAFRFWELLILSATVQAGLALPMVLHFHRLSVSGLSANLAVVPLISAAVPAAFLAVFTGWSLPAAAAGWLLELSRRVVEWHARWEPAWRCPDPPFWLAAAAAASLVLLAWSARWKARWRWAAGLAWTAGMVLLVWHPFAPEVRPGSLEVTALDVGQGDSLLLASPGGRLMLLDTGGTPSYDGRPSAFDVGEDVVSPYLWTRSIRRLDVVALSHLHEDHAGGLASILRNFRPAEVWTGPLADSPQTARLRELVRRSGARLRVLEAGCQLGFGGVQIAVLAPAAGEPPGSAGDQDSLVLRLRFGRRSFLLTGDMPAAVENRLAAQGALERTDVLKVPHHGSRTAAGSAMLERVRPSLAMISAGYANPYNHPHPQLLARLAEWRATPLRTDLFGQIRVITDGRGLEVALGLPLALR